MKKIIALSVLSLGIALATERPAQAWVNSKFGVGLNWHLQSGGNNFLWGVFRNGQVPGPETFQQGGPFTPPGYQQGPGGFQYYGAAPAAPGNTDPTATPANAAPNRNTTYLPTFGAIPTWNPQSYYQNVNYVPGYYSPYPQYAPTYWNQPAYAPPAYWHSGW